MWRSAIRPGGESLGRQWRQASNKTGEMNRRIALAKNQRRRNGGGSNKAAAHRAAAMAAACESKWLISEEK